MKTSPSCNRIAATRLVTSCQTFTDGGDHTQSYDAESLDSLRSTYAARLALCEIDGAGTAIPPSCLAVTVSQPPQKSRFGFVNRHKSHDTSMDQIPKQILEQCLKTLESRPQWWTSYSNSRQNALIICQASRMEKEKEELLDLHQSIAKSSLKLSTGLQEALRDAATQHEQQKEFTLAVQRLQEKVVADLDMTDSLFKRLFARFLREFETGINSLQEAIAATLKNVRSGASLLERVRYEIAEWSQEMLTVEQDIGSVSNQVGALQRALDTAHQNAITKSKEALLAQESSASTSKDLATSIHMSLELLMGSDMEKIYRGMERFDAAMVC